MQDSMKIPTNLGDLSSNEFKFLLLYRTLDETKKAKIEKNIFEKIIGEKNKPIERVSVIEGEK